MRTYLTANNSRGKEVTAGNPTYAHLRGWHAGVRIQAGVDEETGRDWFNVYATSGSSGGAGDTYLGTVKDTAEGPVWEPRTEPAGWSVYNDGELVFSVDTDKWQTIGPAIERIMTS